MESNRTTQLESVLANLLGHRVQIQSTCSVSGGCISRAERVRLSGGRQVFVKSGRDHAHLFQAEVQGLQALAASQTIPVAQVIGVGQAEDAGGIIDLAAAGKTSADAHAQGETFLILEPIDSKDTAVDFWQQFGGQLADLHRTTSDQFGFVGDNFIGASPQPNTPHADWCQFFAVNRLEHQIALASAQGLATPELVRRAAGLCNRLPELLGSDQPPALLHGDLWSGNYMVSSTGGPVLIDPAVYYGHREAEFSLPLLFGGFPAEFFESYQAAWPLDEGWQERVEIYKLYHLLNHLNLFGASYLAGCLDILRRFA